MMRRLLVVALVLGLLAAQVGAEEYRRPFEGYCVDGEPVVTYWDPKLDELFEPDCEGDNFGLRQKEIPSEEPPMEAIPYPDPPADWSAWAQIWFNNQAMMNPYRDVIPYVTANSGRTLIPIRMVTEGLGGTAEWDQVNRKVTIMLGDRYMEMTIDKAEAVANGKAVTLDQPPLIWLNRTMVPLRVVVEAFGAQVGWNGEIQRVDIILPGITCAPGYCIDWLS